MGERNRHLCPCGSGKRMKECCRSDARATKVRLEQTALRLAEEGKHAEAAKVLEERVALSPRNPMIWNDLGNAYAAAGELDKALAALKRAHEVDPEYPLPLYNLGLYTLERCRQLEADHASDADVRAMAEEAIEYFQASLARDPDNAACHQNIAIAYRIVKDAQRAGAHVVEALRLNPALELPAVRWRDRLTRFVAGKVRPLK